MRIIISLLLAGIIWTQVTPKDEKGCAGYSPTITQDDRPVQVQPYRESSPPPPASSFSPEPIFNPPTDNYSHSIGDNQGHGQFDEDE